MKRYLFFSSMTKWREQEIQELIHPETVPIAMIYREIGDVDVMRIHLRGET
ncbi:hypothetical protein HJB79_22105 [Rhizobium lentis]|nr:hypothetical protein [Rhizobium lentis]